MLEKCNFKLKKEKYFTYFNHEIKNAFCNLKNRKNKNNNI